MRRGYSAAGPIAFAAFARRDLRRAAVRLWRIPLDAALSIAREASLSPYYFTRAFTSYVGVPPYRYLIQLRVQRASQLLRDTELSVTQICQRVGFNSLSHFTTTFRRHTGLSPTGYRRSTDWQRNVNRFSTTTEPLITRPRFLDF